MFSLPIIFLCNTLFFAAVLEERFKIITTMVISAVAYILSLISWNVVSGIFAGNSNADMISNAVCVFWLLLASVFISSGNITDKLFTGLILVSNYSFLNCLVPLLLAFLPFGNTGIAAMLIANVVYILFTLVMLALYIRPMHYFFRRSVSVLSIGLCLLQAICWFTAVGGANRFFRTESPALRFFLSLFLYIVIIFTDRAVYSASKYKARDIVRAQDNEIMNIEADSFGTMLSNIESLKQTRSNAVLNYGRIRDLAANGKLQEIMDITDRASFNETDSPLFGNYCENRYINAVVATKAALAAENGVSFESNIQLGDTRIKAVELCILINDLLAEAIDKASAVSTESSVRLSVFPAESSVTIEVIGSAVEDESEAFTKRTIYSFLKDFFTEKDDGEDDKLSKVRDIIASHSGKMSISTADGTVITRVGINY